MRIPAALVILVVPMLWLGCSKTKTPPAEPELPPVITSLADISQTQDGLRLNLIVDLVVWEGDSSLTVGVKVVNTNGNPIQYDPGGCGCPNPGSSMQMESGGFCFFYPRRLCPCSWGSTVELVPNGEIGIADQFPMRCASDFGEAVGGFSYYVELNGERVGRYLEVRWPFPGGDGGP